MTNEQEKSVNRINYSFIKLLTGSDLSKRRIPYMTIRNPSPGPVVWITACLHGDETGGTVIIHEIFKKLRRNLCRGSIHAFPLVNPFGFEAVSRHIVLSKEDLNRSFPGDERGSLAERIAHKVFTYITDTHPSLVLDLHNDWNKSIPYVLIDPPQKIPVDGTIRKYAANTGLLMIQDNETLSTSLTHNLIAGNIPALVLEMGESYIINERNIETGYLAVLNILRELDMITLPPETSSYNLPAEFKNKLLYYSSRPLSSTSGLIRFFVKPGDTVKKGQRVARIYNAFGKVTETIFSVHSGIVIGLTDTAISFPGSPVMAMGYFE